jgi:hypothetical protein
MRSDRSASRYSCSNPAETYLGTTGYEVGWAPEPASTLRKREVGNRTRTLSVYRLGYPAREGTSTRAVTVYVFMTSPSFVVWGGAGRCRNVLTPDPEKCLHIP